MCTNILLKKFRAISPLTFSLSTCPHYEIVLRSHLSCSKTIALGMYESKESTHVSDGYCSLYSMWRYVTRRGSKFYLEYIFISGATVCVVRHIRDHSIFFHSYCPHRHHHLLSSQNGCIQDLCVLQRGQENQPKSLHIAHFHRITNHIQSFDLFSFHNLEYLADFFM